MVSVLNAPFDKRGVENRDKARDIRLFYLSKTTFGRVGQQDSEKAHFIPLTIIATHITLSYAS
jgi:hypothetical protein